jgi:hypothetical protein
MQRPAVVNPALPNTLGVISARQWSSTSTVTSAASDSSTSPGPSGASGACSVTRAITRGQVAAPPLSLAIPSNVSEVAKCKQALVVLSPTGDDPGDTSIPGITRYDRRRVKAVHYVGKQKAMLSRGTAAPAQLAMSHTRSSPTGRVPRFSICSKRRLSCAQLFAALAEAGNSIARLDALNLQAVEFHRCFAAEHVDQDFELALGGIDFVD